ncbi:MAG: glycosyltransferase family 39 protein, partial [Gammaproteobacteria bacterium]
MTSPAAIRDHLPLVAIILLGAALRIYNLGAESIWLDEALSWQQARLPLNEMLRSVAADVHPPLFALILHTTISLFGDSEFAMRLPSAFFGTVSIWLTWAVCRQLFNHQVALLAALLAAVSVFAVRYSQEIRMYSLSSCLALLSMLFLLRLLDANAREKTNVHTIAYCVSSTLLIYSHIYGLFIIMMQNVYVFGLLNMRPSTPLSLRRWLIMQLVLAIAFLPWVSVLLDQISRTQTNFWLQKPDSGNLIETFRLYMGSMVALWLSLVAVSAGFIALCMRRTTNLSGSHPGNAWVLLGLWLLIPVLLSFLLSQFTQPFYNARYTIVSTPAWTLLTAAGLM